MKKYIRYFGILILLIILLKIDVGNLLSIIYQIDILYLAAAIILNIPLLVLKSYRWNRLLNMQNIKYSLFQSFFIYLGSLYIGFVTPGRLGEFTKALHLRSDKGISLSKGMSSVLIDRLFDMYLLIILGIIGIWKFGILGKMSGASMILFIFVIFAPLLMLNERFTERFLNLLYNLAIVKKFKGNIEEKFEDFYSGINQMVNPKLLFSAFLTLLSYMVFFIQCYIIAIAMSISINFVTITLFMAISNLVSFIPISVSGLGTRDAILIYLFSLIDLKPEIAVSYAFIVFITFFVCGGLMGSLAWWIKPINISNSKNIILS